MLGNKSGFAALVKERVPFDQRVERMSRDARLILEKGIRHGIIQATPRGLDAPSE